MLSLLSAHSSGLICEDNPPSPSSSNGRTENKSTVEEARGIPEGGNSAKETPGAVVRDDEIVTASESVCSVMKVEDQAAESAKLASEMKEMIEHFSDTEYEGESMVVQTEQGEVVQVDTLKQTTECPASPDAVPLFQENPVILPKVYERVVRQVVRCGKPAMPTGRLYRDLLTALVLMLVLCDALFLPMIIATVLYTFFSYIQQQSLLHLKPFERVSKVERAKGRL